MNIKFIGLILILISSYTYASNSKCALPAGNYTNIFQVLNHFVLGNGNPNWGDWCSEQSNAEKSLECNNELDQWDAWLVCIDPKTEPFKENVAKLMEEDYSVELNKRCIYMAEKEGFDTLPQADFYAAVDLCKFNSYQQIFSK